MAFNKMTLAVAMLIASAAPSPVWGQNSSVVTLTEPAVIGNDAQGTWQTDLWIINTCPTCAYVAPQITFWDAASGQQVLVNTASGGQAPVQTGTLTGGPLAHGSTLFAVTSLVGNAPAEPLVVKVETASGLYAIVVSVQHVDPSGNPIKKDWVTYSDSSLSPTAATSFGGVLDTRRSIGLTLYNPNATSATVTLQAYGDRWDLANEQPFATAQPIVVPPSGMVPVVATQVLASDPQYQPYLANFLATYGVSLPQGYLAVTSDQPVQVTGSLVSLPAFAGDSMAQVSWPVFPTAVNPVLAAVTNESYGTNLVSGGYAILWGSFASSGNTVMLNGRALPASVMLYQSTSQINVKLGQVPAPWATFAVVNPNGISNAVSAPVSASQ
jgi:hypothetical protein